MDNATMRSAELSQRDWDWLVYEMREHANNLESKFLRPSPYEDYKLLDRAGQLRKLANHLEAKT